MSAEPVVTEYFAAMARRDAGAMAELWAPGGIDYLAGQGDLVGPNGVRAYPPLFRFWDGGAVEIAGTVEEGDDVAGFQVVHLPGHAPGLVGLFRERDRLALSSDCFYVLDIETSIKGQPRVPHRAFNQDEEQARASIRRLAALEPAAAWPAHGDPLTGNVRGQLERIA